MNENLVDSLELVKPFIHQLHFSNCGNVPASELYGDFHLPIAATGFLTVDVISDLLWKEVELGTSLRTGSR